MLGVAWFRVRPSLFELLFRSCFILGLAFVCLYVGAYLAFVCSYVGVSWLVCACMLVCFLGNLAFGFGFCVFVCWCVFGFCVFVCWCVLACVCLYVGVFLGNLAICVFVC